MAVTTNTMALCAVNSYPTSCSVTTNLAPVISTIAAVEKQDITPRVTLQPPGERPLGLLILERILTETVAISDAVGRMVAKTRRITEPINGEGYAINTFGNDLLAQGAALKVYNSDNSKATFSLWFKSTALPPAGQNSHFPLYWMDPGFDGFFQFDLNDTGDIGIYLQIDAAEFYDVSYGKLTLNVWHHFVITLDHVADQAKVYLDNKLRSTFSTTGRFVDDTSAKLLLDANTNEVLVDDLRVYNTALTGTDVDELHRGRHITTGLVHHWKFDNNLSDSVGAITFTASTPTYTNTDLPSLAAYDSPITFQKGKIRALATETVAVSETLARRTAKTRALATQTVTVSENLARLATKTRALATQTVSISESVVRVKGKIKALATETVAIGESIVRSCAKIRTRSETVTIGESIARLAAKIRALATQTVTVAEGTPTTQKGKLRALATETVAVSGGTLTRLAAKTRALATQTVSIAENLARLAAKKRTLSTETISVSDAVDRVKTVFGGGNNVVRTLTENVAISDSAARLAQKIRALATQTVTVSESLAKSVGNARALATETVAVSGGTLARRTQKIRVLATQTVSVLDAIRAFKNGIELIAPQRPDKGGHTFQLLPKKGPRKKLQPFIRYPVYHVTELEKIERLRRLRRQPNPVIIPAYMQNIHRVIAPFVVLNPAKNTVNVRFAAVNAAKHVIFAGKPVPVLVPAASQRLQAHKASAPFVMQQKAIERYAIRLNKLQKLMKLFVLAENMPS